MRLALVFTAFLASVEANRRAPSAPLKADVPRMWGYPYGWGISDEDEPEIKEDIEAIKPVKRVTNKKVPPKCTGWLNRDDKEEDPHVHVTDIADLMEHSFE